MKNPITLITSIVAGLHFCCADSYMRSSANFRIVFSETRTPAHWMPSSDQILTQNDHSWSFKVIRFGVNEGPLKSYIVQYNNCGLECEGSEYIASERSENRHLRPPHSHLTPLANQQEYPYKSYTLLETRIPGLQFCRWQYTGSSSNLRTVLSESQKRQFIICRNRNRF